MCVYLQEEDHSSPLSSSLLSYDSHQPGVNVEDGQRLTVLAIDSRAITPRSNRLIKSSEEPKSSLWAGALLVEVALAPEESLFKARLASSPAAMKSCIVLDVKEGHRQTGHSQGRSYRPLQRLQPGEP